MNEILKDIAMFNWVFGMFLSFLSNASGIVEYDKVGRKGWRKYRVGYSIREIKLYISLIDDPRIIKKLKRKIIYRRLYPFFMISTIVLIYVANR